jgi:hypothetical protein
MTIPKSLCFSSSGHVVAEQNRRSILHHDALPLPLLRALAIFFFVGHHFLGNCYGIEFPLYPLLFNRSKQFASSSPSH